MRRVFSGRPVAAVAAKHLGYPAADARDRPGATAVEWRDSGAFSVAYLRVAWLRAAGVLCVAGVVQKKVVTVTSCFWNYKTAKQNFVNDGSVPETDGRKLSAL